MTSKKSDPAPEQPQGGGAYVRGADGKLKRVEATEPSNGPQADGPANGAA